jgi:hypothetical protein
MKQVLLILLVFISFQGFSQNFVFGTLEVARYDLQPDFSFEVKWYGAKEACEKLGDGWRLPTVKDFELIFKKSDKKGELNNLKGSLYWTSTEFNDDSAYHLECTSAAHCNAYSYVYSKYGLYNVRAVRDLK